MRIRLVAALNAAYDLKHTVGKRIVVVQMPTIRCGMLLDKGADIRMTPKKRNPWVRFILICLIDQHLCQQIQRTAACPNRSQNKVCLADITKAGDLLIFLIVLLSGGDIFFIRCFKNDLKNVAARQNVSQARLPSRE